jgi:hypothetical protein
MQVTQYEARVQPCLAFSLHLTTALCIIRLEFLPVIQLALSHKSLVRKSSLSCLECLIGEGPKNIDPSTQRCPTAGGVQNPGVVARQIRSVALMKCLRLMHCLMCKTLFVAALIQLMVGTVPVLEMILIGIQVSQAASTLDGAKFAADTEISQNSGLNFTVSESKTCISGSIVSFQDPTWAT